MDEFTIFVLPLDGIFFSSEHHCVRVKIEDWNGLLCMQYAQNETIY